MAHPNATAGQRRPDAGPHDATSTATPAGAKGAAAIRAALSQDPNADQAASPGRIQLSATSEIPIAVGGRVVTTTQHTATSSAARQAPGQLSTSGRLQTDTGDSGASPLVTTTAVAPAAVTDAA